MLILLQPVTSSNPSLTSFVGGSPHRLAVQVLAFFFFAHGIITKIAATGPVLLRLPRLTALPW